LGSPNAFQISNIVLTKKNWLWCFFLHYFPKRLAFKWSLELGLVVAATWHVWAIIE